MKKLILLVLIAALLLAACGGGNESHTKATVYFKAGFNATCDSVTYESDFVTLHWGSLSASYPALEIDHVVNEPAN